ncbi:unnamed protein product [Adineta ricciae]|uniref:RING-type domain-containing protein n=1 Tax=Adineta ricciae TaxID=249248 RepID=A0A813S2G2_ADIRI|nr:unnamed protein product [Adineta ricciae]CAF1633036.1 unnamed protein product [Adineta ricciae]
MPKPARRVIGKPAALTFNNLHGKGIILSNNNRQATRTSGFGDAIVFSSRTIRTYEKVFLKHRQKQVDWIGSLRVGFCMHEPQTQFTQDTLPSLAFKHLTDKAGYWLRACSDELLRTSPIIYVYYSFDGQIYVGGYGQTTPAQAVLTINEHSGPYYLFCEVYGKTDQIEIVDESTLPDQSLVNEGVSLSIHGNVMDSVNAKLANNTNLSHLQYFNYLFPSNPPHTATFLSTTKHNVVFDTKHRIAYVNNLRMKSSYTFLDSSMKVGDVLICKVMDCDANISSILLFGLTTQNPSTLQNQSLPEETNTLVDLYSSSRWFIDHDIEANISLYDELAFWFESDGHIYLSIDNRPPITLKVPIIPSNMLNMTFYPFFDLYGQITSLYLYNFSTLSKLNFGRQSTARTLCVICCENLADTQLLPCQCILCSQCASVIKRPSLLSDCPFDRKHITQIQPLL